MTLKLDVSATGSLQRPKPAPPPHPKVSMLAGRAISMGMFSHQISVV